MADEAAPVEGAESPDEAAPEGEAEPTTQPDPEATWKRRIAGKDQALTTFKKENESLKGQLADYQRKVAEYENANLSEVEKLQREREQWKELAEQAKQEAASLRLRAKFPLASELLGESMPLDESALADIESRLATLKVKPDEEIVEETNPSNPGRRTSPPAKPAQRTSEDLKAELASFGNPFARQAS